MKKIILLTLAAMLLLAACGEKTPEATTEATTQATTEATTQATTEETTAPTEATTASGLQLAPDFTVYTADGKAVKLSDFRGKPVVLNFWASTCGPCKSEMPDFQMAYDHFGEDYHFVMVNMTDGYWDDEESASTFIEDREYTFPVYFDLDQDAAWNYGINAIPATFFIDEEGGAVAWYSGAMDYETLQVGLNILVGIYPEGYETQPVE